MNIIETIKRNSYIKQKIQNSDYKNNPSIIAKINETSNVNNFNITAKEEIAWLEFILHTNFPLKNNYKTNKQNFIREYRNDQRYINQIENILLQTAIYEFFIYKNLTKKVNINPNDKKQLKEYKDLIVYDKKELKEYRDFIVKYVHLARQKIYFLDKNKFHIVKGHIETLR